MIISPDHFRYDADGRYDPTSAASQRAWASTQARAQALLTDPRFRGLTLLVGVPGAGKSTWLTCSAQHDQVYVDATFLSPASRRPFLDLAANSAKPIRAVFLDTPLEECLRRNAERPQGRRVPESTMFRYFRNLVPPDLEEGFAEVTRLTYTPPLR